MTTDEIDTKLLEIAIRRSDGGITRAMREAFALGQASMQPLIEAHVEYEKLLWDEIDEGNDPIEVRNVRMQDQGRARAKIKELTK